MKDNFRSSFLSMLIFVSIQMTLIKLINSESNGDKNAQLRDKIIENITQNYKKHERPDELLSTPTTVEVSIQVDSINSISAVNNDFSVEMLLRQRWIDKRLSWENITEFQSYRANLNVNYLKDKLWLPDLFFRNGKNGHVSSMTMMNNLIRINPQGEILYSQKISMVFTCEMHFQLFPFDTQRCEINMGSYSYTGEELEFQWRSNYSIKVKATIIIPEFIAPPKVKAFSCTTRTITGSYTCINAVLQLKREWGSYKATFVISVLIVMTSWVAFWIELTLYPARISATMLSLLAILIQITQVELTLPRVSYTKAIDVWFIGCIIFVFSAVLEFVVANTLLRKKKKCLRSSEQVTMEMEQLSKPSDDETHKLENSRFISKKSITSTIFSLITIDNTDSIIDACSRILFPFCFLLFNIFYWSYNLTVAGSVGLFNFD